MLNQIGNAFIDYETNEEGSADYYLGHALISEETHNRIVLNCNYSSPSSACEAYWNQAHAEMAWGSIYRYDIYAPLCNSGSDSLPVSKTSSLFYKHRAFLDCFIIFRFCFVFSEEKIINSWSHTHFLGDNSFWKIRDFFGIFGKWAVFEIFLENSFSKQFAKLLWCLWEVGYFWKIFSKIISKTVSQKSFLYFLKN